MGCGRSFHRLAAIAKAADFLVDFTHDMQLHPLADMAALGTHEQTVLYQAAKLRALDVYKRQPPDVPRKTWSRRWLRHRLPTRYPAITVLPRR